MFLLNKEEILWKEIFVIFMRLPRISKINSHENTPLFDRFTNIPAKIPSLS